MIHTQRQHVGLRIPYRISKGGGVMAPILVWQWVCDGCAHLFEDSADGDEGRKAVQKLADEHVCT